MLLDRMCDLCNRKRNQADPKKCVELRDRGTKAELRVSGESRVSRAHAIIIHASLYQGEENGARVLAAVEVAVTG
jgi:hypothetical protein